MPISMNFLSDLIEHILSFKTLSEKNFSIEKCFSLQILSVLVLIIYTPAFINPGFIL